MPKEATGVCSLFQVAPGAKCTVPAACLKEATLRTNPAAAREQAHCTGLLLH